MMSVSTIWTVKAYDGDTDEITVDGYDITIEDNTDSETVVSTFVDGVNYQITFDKTDEEFEMVTSEYSAYFLGFGLYSIHITQPPLIWIPVLLPGHNRPGPDSRCHIKNHRQPHRHPRDSSRSSPGVRLHPAF